MDDRFVERTRRSVGLRFAVIVVAAWAAAATAAFAAEPESGGAPDADALYARMLDAVAPEQLIAMRTRLTVTSENEETKTYDALVARRAFDGDLHTTVAVRAPDSAAGTVMLWGTRGDDGQPVEAIYGIAEGRVREIAPVMPNDNFLGSDFTRADLGFVPRGDMKLELVGEETVAGHDVYEIKATPPEDAWYYSRIYTAIDARTGLPVRREYYDRAGRLWKRAEYESVRVNGVPLVTRVTMHDVQRGTMTDLLVRDVRIIRGNEDDALFRRSYLPHAEARLRKLLASAATEQAAAP